MSPKVNELKPHRIIADHSQLPPCLSGNFSGQYFAFNFLAWSMPGCGSMPGKLLSQYVPHYSFQRYFGTILIITILQQTCRVWGPATFVFTDCPCNFLCWFWGRELTELSFLLWQELKTYSIFSFLNSSLFLFHECKFFSYPFGMIIIVFIFFLNFSPLSNAVFIYAKFLISVLFACFSFGLVWSWLRISSHIW